MDAATIALGLSQLGLAIAGFSGITIAFVRTPGRLTDLEIYRLRWLFGTSFGALFLGLVPVALGALDVADPTRWKIGSGLLAGFTLALYGLQLAPTRRYLRESPAIFQLWILYGLAAGHAISLGFQVSAAAGAWGNRVDGIFLCGLVWLLFHAAYQFSRILFIRPR